MSISYWIDVVISLEFSSWISWCCLLRLLPSHLNFWFPNCDLNPNSRSSGVTKCWQKPPRTLKSVFYPSRDPPVLQRSAGCWRMDDGAHRPRRKFITQTKKSTVGLLSNTWRKPPYHLSSLNYSGQTIKSMLMRGLPSWIELHLGAFTWSDETQETGHEL